MGGKTDLNRNNSRTISFSEETHQFLDMEHKDSCMSDMGLLADSNGNRDGEPTPSLASAPRSTAKRCLAATARMTGSILARVLFLVHSVVCIFIAVASIPSPYIYLLIAPVSLIVVESFVTLKVRKNVEWKWFTPSIAIYQMCTVPSIWLMEYHAFTDRINRTDSQLAVTDQLTLSLSPTSTIRPYPTTQPPYSLSTKGLVANATTFLPNSTHQLINSLAAVVTNSTALNETTTFINSVTSTSTLPNSTVTSDLLTGNTSYNSAALVGLNQREEGCMNSNYNLTDIFLDTKRSVSARVDQYCHCHQLQCITLMQQILLLLMIVGRWLLPRGQHLSRDQKAQLLLVNIAISADILELFELMKEDQVKNNEILVIIILTLWSCSLIQFAIVSTAVAKKTCRGCSCFKTEIWSLVTLLFLDDAPFLTLRLVCIIKYEITSYSSYFFAAKNVLVLALDLNRIFALHRETQKAKKRKAFQQIEMGVMENTNISHIRR